MKRLLLLLLTLLCPLVKGQEPRWQNSYDSPLNFVCPLRQSISSISSQHDDYREDRLWDFTCQNTFQSDPQCFWSPYANNFDEQFTFECPTNYVLSGMSSYHENKHEDRRWKFYCCQDYNYCNSGCQWSTYVNNFDEKFWFSVPSLNYLVGVESYHENKYEDRRWKYRYCTRSHC